jgi:hypothetical protein
VAGAGLTVSATASYRPRAEAGDLDAAVELPAGLSDALATGAPVTFGVVAHPSRRLSGSVAQAVANSIAGQIGATRLAVAATVATAQQVGQPVDPAAVAAAAREVTSPLLLLPSDVSSSFSVIGYFAPAMAMLFLFFTLGSGARSVVKLRPLDMVTLGQLYLNEGRWGDRQVIPASWVEQSATTQVQARRGDTAAHGYQWWVTTVEDSPAYAALGSHGQMKRSYPAAIWWS